MAKNIRFGSFVREITIQQNQLSYNELAPKIAKDDQGNDRYNTEIHCTEFTFLTPRGENPIPSSDGTQNQSDQKQDPVQTPDPINEDGDDLPF